MEGFLELVVKIKKIYKKLLRLSPESYMWEATYRELSWYKGKLWEMLEDKIRSIYQSRYSSTLKTGAGKAELESCMYETFKKALEIDRQHLIKQPRYGHYIDLQGQLCNEKVKLIGIWQFKRAVYKSQKASIEGSLVQWIRRHWCLDWYVGNLSKEIYLRPKSISNSYLFENIPASPQKINLRPLIIDRINQEPNYTILKQEYPKEYQECNAYNVTCKLLSPESWKCEKSWNSNININQCSQDFGVSYYIFNKWIAKKYMPLMRQIMVDIFDELEDK